MQTIAATTAFIVTASLFSPGVITRTLTVTANAYDAAAARDRGAPRIGACNRARPVGANVVAVSPDLARMGLDCGAKVKIKGMGDFVVWDRMDDRWSRRIDIVPARDIRDAEAWGEKLVTLDW